MLAATAKPEWKPENKLPDNPRDFKTPNYGMATFGDLFTPRQLVALTTFSDLVGEARERIREDALLAGLPDNDAPLDAGGTGARAYAEAVSVYLGMVIGRASDYWTTLATWEPSGEFVGHTFTKQALPMVWDYTESNPFSSVSGNWKGTALDWVPRVMLNLPAMVYGNVMQSDAQNQTISNLKVISTDPPYYDNISYADLSDFFYVWLRRSLRSIFPKLLATISVPKAEELVATPYRHGNKQSAEKFFLDGMTHAMHNLAVRSHPSAPITIYYAFKQSETDAKDSTSSTGWETFLNAVMKSGLALTGTWPLRTERSVRSVAINTNALASSILLVCRPRALDSGVISRRQFIRQLNEALPISLDAMTRESEGEHSPVAPVDLSQAIIGPGMAIFSRYDAVLEADGTPMTVKTALQLINRFLAEDDFDQDTQFCLRWFEQYHWEKGQFGEADVLARAKATSVNGLVEAGVLRSGGNIVQLLRPADFSIDWNPEKDNRISIWEVLHQLINALRSGGETQAGSLLSHPSVQSRAEAARQLAYRLYTLCERKGWAEDARAYNEIVTSWSGIESAAAKEPGVTQRTLFE